VPSITKTVRRAEQDVNGTRRTVSSRWRASGQAHRAHEAVGDDGRAGEVAGVLEEREEDEHQRHEGDERQQHADAGHEAVDEKAFDPGAVEMYEGE